MLTLTIAAKAPLVAYPSLIAAAIINADESTSPIDLKFIDAPLVDKDFANSNATLVTDEAIHGDEAILRTLQKLFPKSIVSGPSSAHFISLAYKAFLVRDFKILTPSFEQLEAHLNFRSFIDGYAISIGDIAVWGVLRANMVVGSIVKNGTYANIARWYKFIEGNRFFGGSVETFQKEVAELKKAAKAGQKKEASKASYEIGLVDAVKGKVVTRFPPEPSGYLHIGHAKAAILNQYFAQMYEGKMIIRFDDTNPSKEKAEFEQSILEDCKLLGITPDRVTHSSSYFQEMYDLCVKMIKEGKAYCDDTPLELMREQRGEGIASARRERSVEENLEIFEKEMKNGTDVGLKNCVRAKISVDDNNKTLRDPVIYRCNLTPHHITGDKWKIYPTYDFCCPIVDAIEGVTHALRTIEYRDRNAQYDWMLKALNLRKVHVWDFSRINFVRTLLSKRKLQWFVDQGVVGGWDDPRFPTVRGVRRRGMTIEGLKRFIISQGPSKNILNLDWNLIWAINKKIIDPVAPRHTAVEATAVKLHLTGGPEKPYSEEKLKHKKNPDIGTKKVIFSSDVLLDLEDVETLKVGEEVTLMDWGNCIINSINKEGDKIVSVVAKLHLDGDFKKTEKKLHWLADTNDKVPIKLVDFDHLITKEKIEEGENFEDFLTPKTEFVTEGYGDVNIKDIKEGDIIQFERKGYFRCDKPYKDGQPAVFFTVPDGKAINRYGAK